MSEIELGSSWDSEEKKFRDPFDIIIDRLDAIIDLMKKINDSGRNDKKSDL